MTTTVKRTALYDLHRALGARMTLFGGFEMPLSYRGIIEEHRAVRTAAGLFDLSHMGELEVCGGAALDLLERALTNSARRLVPGQAQYTLMCEETGGTLDDLIVYCLAPARYMLCVNAANIDADREWLRGALSPGAELFDRSDETALLALQGPAAERILARATSLSLDQVGRFHSLCGEVAGTLCLVARTGYTGEDGFEIFVAANRAAALFEALLSSGKGDGLMPCGLGARDTLRMEAGLPLYGHELERNISLLEAGLASFVRFGRGFIGERALLAARERGPARHLLGVRTDDSRSVARHGYKLLRQGNEVGVITSGTFAPSFARPLAIGLVEKSVPAGAQLAVEIRSRMVSATAVPLPFYRRSAVQAAR